MMRFSLFVTARTLTALWTTNLVAAQYGDYGTADYGGNDYGGGNYGGQYDGGYEEPYSNEYTCYKGKNIKGCGYAYQWASERGYVFSPSRYAGTGELGYTRHFQIYSIGECAEICKSERAEAGEYGQDGNPYLCYCIHKAECREPDKRLRETGGTVFSIYPKPDTCPKSFCDKDYFYYDKKFYCQSRGFNYDDGFDGYNSYSKPSGYSKPYDYPNPNDYEYPKPAPYAMPYPKPEYEPYPKPEYEPYPTPEYAPYPKPEYEPYPTPEYEPYPTPEYEPYPTPEYEPYPKPEYEPYPKPEYEPYPTPEYEPYPKPEYQPYPKPEHEPYPKPEHEPYPTPKYEPYPKPEHEPYPKPEHEPYPKPEYEPYPKPEYEPYPRPEYEPYPNPDQYVQPIDSYDSPEYGVNEMPYIPPEDGDPKYLLNPKKGKHGKLNTAKGVESTAGFHERMSALECPESADPEEPNMCPVDEDYLAYAKCFNEPYGENDVFIPDDKELYADYYELFDHGFNVNRLDVSGTDASNKVPNNRIPGMMLRMCFHDNSIDPNIQDFQEYIDGNMEDINESYYSYEENNQDRYEDNYQGNYQDNHEDYTYKESVYEEPCEPYPASKGSKSGKGSKGSKGSKGGEISPYDYDFPYDSESGNKYNSYGRAYSDNSYEGTYDTHAYSDQYKVKGSKGGKSSKCGKGKGSKKSKGRKAKASKGDKCSGSKGKKTKDCYNMDIEKTWIGPKRYLATSGGDASVLTCPEERFHPNNNYDNTASRVLNALLRKDIPKFQGRSMIEKYGMSYADLLYNGCQAATVYTTTFARPDINNSEWVQPQPGHLEEGQNKLYPGIFRFGRRDACYKDPLAPEGKGKSKGGTDYFTGSHMKFALCGPTELLPGLGLGAQEYDEWFLSRGMSSCNWMALMWTHTTMDALGLECPLKELPTNPASFGDVQVFHKYGNSDLIYFKPGDELDYWRFFLDRGVHTPSDANELSMNHEDSGCEWIVDGFKVNWPLTRTDCVISLDNLKRLNLIGLSNTARIVTDWTKTQATNSLYCSLQMLGGSGKNRDLDCAPEIHGEFVPCATSDSGNINADEHKFGSYVPNNFLTMNGRVEDEENQNKGTNGERGGQIASAQAATSDGLNFRSENAASAAILGIFSFYIGAIALN